MSQAHIILASQSIGRKKLLSTLGIPFEIVPSTLDEEKIVGKDPLETLRLRAKLKCENVVRNIKNKILNIKNTDKKLNILVNPPTKTYLPAEALAKEGNLIPNPYLILSADSGAVLDDKLYGKPKDYKEAFKILSTLSGRTHDFYTATYIIKLMIGPSTPRSDRGFEGVPSRSIKEGKQGGLEYKESIIVDDLDHSKVTFKKMTSEEVKYYLAHTPYTRFAASYALFSTPQAFITRIEGSLSNVVGLPLEKVIPILINPKFRTPNSK